jgi:polyhydroxyalkanoate synthesis regulator phasin
MTPLERKQNELRIKRTEYKFLCKCEKALQKEIAKKANKLQKVLEEIEILDRQLGDLEDEIKDLTFQD